MRLRNLSNRRDSTLTTFKVSLKRYTCLLLGALCLVVAGRICMMLAIATANGQVVDPFNQSTNPPLIPGDREMVMIRQLAEHETKLEVHEKIHVELNTLKVGERLATLEANSSIAVKLLWMNLLALVLLLVQAGMKTISETRKRK